MRKNISEVVLVTYGNKKIASGGFNSDYFIYKTKELLKQLSSI
tara:strand:- start:84633 stop:84761 length:129 start_codon:yes stop_codon:yes gene_type:complete